jgi:hypothetical protein
MADDYTPLELSRLLELGAELSDLGRLDGPFTSRTSPDVLTRVPAVFATARYAVDAGKAALDLYAEGRQLVAMVLIRGAFESAITSLWLVQSREAVRGFVGEEYRQRRALSQSMALTASQVFREGATKVAHIDEEKVETIAAGQARSFEQLCLTLRGGRDAYTHFRILSSMAHPSATLSDFYLEPADHSPTGCQMYMTPKDVGHDSWAFLCVASMMWAQRAIDHLDVEHSHRSRLREVARELSVPETLELTPQALAAVNQAEQQRRRAGWKGRRRRGQE